VAGPGRDSETPSAEALKTNAKMWAARVSAWEGWYGCVRAGEAGDESEGCVAERGVESVEGMCEVREVVFSSADCANCPVLWMIDPSLRDRINVDCTPGREVRWESSAVTCWGTCCVRLGV
jgi:hypothetical protein